MMEAVVSSKEVIVHISLGGEDVRVGKLLKTSGFRKKRQLKL